MSYQKNIQQMNLIYHQPEEWLNDVVSFMTIHGSCNLAGCL